MVKESLSRGMLRVAMCGCLLCGGIPLAAQTQEYLSEVWSPDLGNGMYKNPVIHADYSDPDVCAVGNDFYLTASSFSCVPGLPILHSKDLVNWKVVNYALKELVPTDFYATVQHGRGVWAPSIRYHEGEYYIYWGDPDFGVYMVKAEDPAGEWSEPVLVKAAKGIIDPCPLWDDDGKCYLAYAWAGSRAQINSVLCVAEMNAEGTKVVGPSRIVYDGNDDVNHTAEGPKFYKRNGYYDLKGVKVIRAFGKGIADGRPQPQRVRAVRGAARHGARGYSGQRTPSGRLGADRIRRRLVRALPG